MYTVKKIDPGQKYDDKGNPVSKPGTGRFYFFRGNSWGVFDEEGRLVTTSTKPISGEPMFEVYSRRSIAVTAADYLNKK